jgi:hypothetical protein
MTQNPWFLLPKSGIDLILQMDQRAVSDHNYKSNDQHRFHLEFVPEPFIGYRDAPVVALNANPGYNPLEVEIHNNPNVRKLMLDNLIHNYPGFYYLSKDLDLSTGAAWWRKKLRKLIEDTSNDLVSKNLLVVESMAYHSKSFKYVKLPSQQYNCHLLKMAIERKALVIIMRSKNVWFDLVPALRFYKNVIVMSNPQSTYFSPGNLPRYDDVVEIISRSNNLLE